MTHTFHAHTYTQHFFHAPTHTLHTLTRFINTEHAHTLEHTLTWYINTEHAHISPYYERHTFHTHTLNTPTFHTHFTHATRYIYTEHAHTLYIRSLDSWTLNTHTHFSYAHALNPHTPDSNWQNLWFQNVAPKLHFFHFWGNTRHHSYFTFNVYRNLKITPHITDGWKFTFWSECKK